MKHRILILGNCFIVFYNMRKELIKGLLDAGYEVYLSLPASEKNVYFSDMGCHIIATTIDRRGTNIISDLKLLFYYRRMMKRIRPHAVLSCTIKPNIYGTLASRSCHIPQICNISGIGSSFINNGLIHHITNFLYKISLKNAHKVFFQNTEHRDLFLKNRLVKDNWDILPGSGVNLDEFSLQPLPTDDKIHFVFVGRVMADKGIDQYFECAETITQKYPHVRFHIAGYIEEKNKYKNILRSLTERGIIQYEGFVDQIATLLKKCHCVILPSFSEGMPNVLLEAAATGRACIASNIPACKEIIDEGRNGYLFEVKNSKALSEKVEKYLALTFEQKVQMGREGRMMMEQKFDRRFVVEKYLREVKTIVNSQTKQE